MNLIDEKDDIPFAFFDFVEKSFDSFLEFPFVFRSGKQGGDIEGSDGYPLEILRNLAYRNPVSDSFDNRRLTNSRITDKDWIILGPSRKNLDRTPCLVFTSDNRINFACLGFSHEINRVLLQNGTGFSVLGWDEL